MPDSAQKITHCLCGAVKITVTTVNPKFTVCHCQMCRTWGGGPFFAVQCGTEVTIDGEVKEFDSSAWAARGFCAECGTHLYVRFKKYQSYNMPVGLFPKLAGLVMDTQYFNDKRPEYYCFTNQTKTMTEAEIQAFFAADLAEE
ncbi:GFA family protein [Photobacterium nomapromontoriensis]|uniref:GFA family protein n=1 Tax=Photobacterium nomapromontoriensis TaxID=2910237 RepID=UPI003D11C122